MWLHGKVALVTGAASGIGHAIARRLADAGAQVFAADLAPGRSEPTSAIVPVALDVCDEGNWVAVVDDIRRRAGGLDILVNNAGAGRSGLIVDLMLADWRAVTAVNLDGAFLGIKHAAPILRDGGGGTIVNIGSIMATVAVSGASAYCASKGGIAALTRAAALELAEWHIRVNAIHPGWTETPLLRARLDDDPERESAMLRGTPAGRLGRSEEVAGAVLYLASDDAAFVTGAGLTIDGGYTLR